MPKLLNDIWKDPVWSKVIAGGILALIGSIWAGIHFDWLPESLTFSRWQFILLLALPVISLALLPWTLFVPSVEPNITLLDVSIPPEDKTKFLTYPLKCYVYLRNDSAVSVDVRISEYRPITVTLKTFVLEVLQVKFREWVPTDHSADRVAVFPGQMFRAWVGLDETKYNSTQVTRLRDKIGTLILLVNSKKVSINL